MTPDMKESFKERRFEIAVFLRALDDAGYEGKLQGAAI
jgi:hypothetical protein